MAGAFIHDLHARFPRAHGQIPLHFQLRQLGEVVGVRHGTGPQAIPDGDGNIVSRQNGTNFIPMGIKEIFLFVDHAPLRHDGTAAGNDARHAPRRMVHEPEQKGGVHRHIVHALAGLFKQGIAKNLPTQVSHLSSHLFQSLVNGNSTDGDRGVS